MHLHFNEQMLTIVHLHIILIDAKKDNIQSFPHLYVREQICYILYRSDKKFMKSPSLDRRSRYSIQVIQQALFEMLEKKPLDQITVVDICNAADVNRGTFYKYYRDVPDLYDKTEDAMVAKIQGLLPTDPPAEGKNNFFMKAVLRVLTESSEFLFITQHHIFSDRLSQKIMEPFIPYIRSLTETYHPGIGEQESALLTEYIMGGCSRVITYWLNSGIKIPAEVIEKSIVEMISRSLTTSDTPSLAH